MLLKRFGFVLIIIAASALYDSCSSNAEGFDLSLSGQFQPLVQIDLDEIKAKGKLVAITGFNPLSYFIYKGRPMGFDYDLLKMFTNELGVELEMIVVSNPDSMYEMMNTGRGDIIAFGQPVTKEGKLKAAYSDPHMEVQQVLVQRKPEGWRKMFTHQIDQYVVRELNELAGMQVHVRPSTSQFERILDIAEEIGYEIDVVPAVGETSMEDLVRMVAEGEISYTIADENVALISSTYFPNLDVQTVVSDKHGLSWAVRRNSPELLNALNSWLTTVNKREAYNMVYVKYFKSRKQLATWAESDFFSSGAGNISDYDDLIRRHARRVGWDWRLLAALIHEESRFDTEACSWAGAEGLMQLLPATASRFGVYDLTNPHLNIKAGTDYLVWLSEYWSDIQEPDERIKYVLASYNVGEGHVRDAMRLAVKNNSDPCNWESVAEFLIKKSKPQFYNDAVVRYGYCRGEVTVNYVKEILYKYNHYLQKILA